MEKKIAIKRNEYLSGLTHLSGALLSIAGLVLLVVYSSLFHKVWHIVSFSIFGSSMILLYTASAVYHLIPKESKWKIFFKKIDLVMIYILIAGTYTPVCLIPLRGGWGWAIFGVIWGLAVLGIIYQASSLKMPGWLSAILYILMGWLIMIALLPLLKTIAGIGFAWLFTGGMFYTLGVIFFGLDKIYPNTKWLSNHDMFHVFVLAGSFSHFWFMWRFIMHI